MPTALSSDKIGPLSGYTIGVTADRRADEQMAMLAGRGASCLHGPTIRTHPLRPEDEIREATEAFLADPPDIVVLTTGIGVRGWLEAADSILLGERLREILGSVTLLSRGPKARGAAITADLEVEWNAASATSDELIDHLHEMGVAGRRVAVQLDGAAGTKLVSALDDMGAVVMQVPVYRWSLPDDVGPAERLVKAVCDRQVDAVTFTARPSVENFVEIATAMGRFDDVVAAFADSVEIFCVGPVCAAGVTEADLGSPLQPDRARLGAMVQQVTSVLAAQSTDFELAGHQVSLQGCMVSVDDHEPARLTGRERQLLDVLTDRPGVVHSKPALLKAVWGRGESDPHVVEVTVGRLRQRLGPAGLGIETVVRRGYRASAS